jgi:hypothetical protein
LNQILNGKLEVHGYPKILKTFSKWPNYSVDWNNLSCTYFVNHYPRIIPVLFHQNWPSSLRENVNNVKETPQRFFDMIGLEYFILF